MARKKSETGVDWFNAETETPRENKIVSAIDGFKGVDAEVPKTREVVDENTGERRFEQVMVRMPAPRGDMLRATTSGGKSSSERLTHLRNRYKLMRSAFQFCRPEDKEIHEERMNIAFYEMQVQAFTERLEAYKKNPERKGDETPRPEQVKLLEDELAKYQGYLAKALRLI